MIVTGVPISMIPTWVDVKSGSLKAQMGRLVTTETGMGVALGSSVGRSVAVGGGVAVVVGDEVAVGVAVVVGVAVAVGVRVTVGIDVNVAVGEGLPKATGSNASVNWR